MQSETTLGSDHVRRFIFEERPVRGHWVHVEGAWRALRAHTHHPAAVNELLGEAGRYSDLWWEELRTERDARLPAEPIPHRWPLATTAHGEVALNDGSFTP